MESGIRFLILVRRVSVGLGILFRKRFLLGSAIGNEIGIVLRF